MILKLRNDSCVAKESLLQGRDTIGVRIPDNWFGEFLAEKGIVFVTTSVNLSGEAPLVDVKDLGMEVDYVIDDGILDGKPSKIVNLVEGKVIERG